jgi:hypothetical protein
MKTFRGLFSRFVLKRSFHIPLDIHCDYLALHELCNTFRSSVKIFITEEEAGTRGKSLIYL